MKKKPKATGATPKTKAEVIFTPAEGPSVTIAPGRDGELWMRTGDGPWRRILTEQVVH